MVKMLCLDVLAMEKEQYLRMLSKFTKLFITSYEEIIRFKGKDLHIKLRERVKLVQQRLRRMGQE